VIVEIALRHRAIAKSQRLLRLQERFELVCVEIARAAWTGAVFRLHQCRSSARDEGSRTSTAVAAHALADGATLVAANLTDMERVPVLNVETELEAGAIRGGVASREGWRDVTRLRAEEKSRTAAQYADAHGFRTACWGVPTTGRASNNDAATSRARRSQTKD